MNGNKETQENGAVGSNLSDPVRQSGRYPYTYAADYLRMKVGDGYGKGLISREAAACCRYAIAKALGMGEEELAKALAEAFIAEGMA